jgi:hypothetical protein
MKTTLLTTVTAIALLAGTSMLSAQNPPNPAPPPKGDIGSGPSAKPQKPADSKAQMPANNKAADSKDSKAKDSKASPKGDIGAGPSGASNRIRHHKNKHPGGAAAVAPSRQTTGMGRNNGAPKGPKGDIGAGPSGSNNYISNQNRENQMRQ